MVVLNQIFSINIYIGNLRSDPRTMGLIEYISNRMTIILASPEEYLVTENATI